MSGASSISLARRALSLLGTRSGIESFDEKTTEAGVARTWYEPSLREVLALSDWSFARKIQRLASHIAPPTPEWQYRYVLPADMIAARRLLNPFGPSQKTPPFELSLVQPVGEPLERTLMADIEPAELVYTANISDPAFFSPLFSIGLVHYLAYNMSFAITGKLDKREQLFQTALFYLNQARAEDANQDRPRDEPDAEWIEAR
jgi:hypothetical protein